MYIQTKEELGEVIGYLRSKPETVSVNVDGYVLIWKTKTKTYYLQTKVIRKAHTEPAILCRRGFFSGTDCPFYAPSNNSFEKRTGIIPTHLLQINSVSKSLFLIPLQPLRSWLKDNADSCETKNYCNAGRTQVFALVPYGRLLKEVSGTKIRFLKDISYEF